MVLKVLVLIFLVFKSVVLMAEDDLLSKAMSSHQKEYQKFQKDLTAEEVDPSKYSEGFKKDYFNVYSKEGDDLLDEKSMSPEVTTKQESFSKHKEALSALEYEEEKVDSLNEKVSTHTKYLNDKIFLPSKFLFLDYASWQREASIKSPSGKKNDLIITNTGLCLGGGVGKRNAFYHTFLDGCFMYGYGNVGAEVNSITYKQSNISHYGAKISLGGGMIVSSYGAEVGLKLPLLYSHQTLDKPSQSKFPGYKVDEGSDFIPMASLYARWPFKRAFVQTEYSYIINGDDLIFWSIGAGLSF